MGFWNKIDFSNLTKESTETRIAFLGQAGFLIKSKAGNTLAIDPYLSDCVERLEGHIGFKRLTPHIIAPEIFCVDAVIATHEHWDHFDIDSMPMMMGNSGTRLYCSVDCDDLVGLCKLDLSRVTYVRPGDNIDIHDFSVHFVDCDHGEGAPDAVGVVVEVDGKRIYEVGDSCLRMDRVDAIIEFGEIDIMIAPINGAFGNMDEEDCARLSDALKPNLTIPCHYGMFASHGGNIGKFYEIMTTKYSERDIAIMAPGEVISLI